jgi:hypothetical protein
MAALKSLYEKENLLKDIETCTFKPEITKYDKYSNKVSFAGNDVVARNNNWQKNKEYKINQMKNAREKQQKQE